MKKLMTLMLGLSLLTGTTAVFAKTGADDTSKTKKTVSTGAPTKAKKTRAKKTTGKKTVSTGAPDKKN